MSDDETNASNNESDDSDVETRNLVRDQNRKKKKSGGFQAMGQWPICAVASTDTGEQFVVLCCCTKSSMIKSWKCFLAYDATRCTSAGIWYNEWY